MFEAFIMNKEIGNPEFNFLFDYQNPIHVYYRWKLYSILIGQCKKYERYFATRLSLKNYLTLAGDGKKKWSMKPFRMFKGGSIWLPPVAPDYSAGMPEELIGTKEKTVDDSKLSESQCHRLITLLRNLTMDRSKVVEAMVFCLNHGQALRDLMEIIIESMRNVDTCPLKKVARLYLLSDILFNSRQTDISLEDGDLNLMEVFKVFRASLSRMKTVCDKDNFRSRVFRVLHYWDVCKVVSTAFIRKVKRMFVDKKNF